MNYVPYLFRLICVCLILAYPISCDRRDNRFIDTSLDYLLLLFISASAISFIYGLASYFSFILFFVLSFLYSIRNRFVSKNSRIKEDLVLINQGKINFHHLIEGKYSLVKLARQLRFSKIKRLEDISFAILKKDGNLSIIPKEKKKPPYQVTLILEGNVFSSTLTKMGKTEQWLIQLLKEKNLTLSDIFLAFYQHDRLFIICND